jgi:D-glycero-beta-D-manno-heptose-7-phosphate kinase
VVEFTGARLKSLVDDFHGKRIAVVGDLMIDRYYWGKVQRVSPEAPVPVVEVESESIRLGGAANVARNIQTLGGTPLLVGLTGDDHPAAMLRGILADSVLDSSGVVADAGRPTTVKTRVIAHGQHVVRIDTESRTDCPADLEDRMLDAIRHTIGSLHGIIIEDYNKGVITRSMIGALTSLAREHSIPVAVDPKFNHFLDFRGVTVFKPNRREAEEVLGGKLNTQAAVEAAGRKLLDLLGAENVLLTRGEEGMSLFESTGGVTHIPTTAGVVQDVSGAGDSVISTLTMALVAGATVREAAALANCAGGIVVGDVGIVPVRADQLRTAALHFYGRGA